MKKYFVKKFAGTGHVLGNGDAPKPDEGSSGAALLEKLEEKKPKKAPPKVSLTEHLQKLEGERKNAPLQFCQDTPVPRVKTDDSEFETQISVLLSNGELSVLAIPLIRRILRNLIMSPTETKYQRLNLSNAKVQEGLVNVPGAVEFVCLCGFEKQEEQLLYKAQLLMDLPQQGLQLLNRHFPEPAAKVEDPIEPPIEPQEIKDIPRRERHTQLLLMKPTDVALPNWFFDRTGAELKIEYFSMIKKKEQDQTFMTTEQRDRLKKPANKYTFAVVRVRLPEGVLLQGEFNGNESVVRVHEWVTDQLRDVGRPFELFLPSRTKLAMSGSVEHCQLMPATLLSFHWTDGLGMTAQEPTVKDELLITAVVDWDQATTVCN